jgi:hypothetical protein
VIDRHSVRGVISANNFRDFEDHLIVGGRDLPALLELVPKTPSFADAFFEIVAPGDETLISKDGTARDREIVGPALDFLDRNFWKFFTLYAKAVPTISKVNRLRAG